jgi:hypothetical protein
VECRMRIIRRGTNELSHIWMRISAGICGNKVKDLSILSEESARARFPKCSALELSSDAILEFGIRNFDALGNDRDSGGCFSGILDLVLRRLVLEMDCRYFRDDLAPVPFWAAEASELEVA